MKENIKTIDEYISKCPEDIKHKLMNIRDIILDTSSDLIETISWGMPTFYYKGNIIHFSAHKHHIGLYCGKEAVEKFNDELQDYKTKNGTIQIPHSKGIDKVLIQAIVKFNIEDNIRKSNTL